MINLLAITLLACRAVVGIPTIEIRGSKFFTSEGNQFFVKGVTYQPLASTNWLTNGDQCKIDAKLIAATGANVIRVYSVDPTLMHDECMKAFEDVGIYVICDMSTPIYSIDRSNPKWTIELRNQFAKVLDGFHQYDNLLALFAGNEVINDPATTIAAPVVKAVIADMKAYRDLMQYRKIPIGYSATDEATTDALQDYLDCGNEDIAADFFAFNKYSWCADSSMTKSGYDQLYKRAEGYDIPIFLSETGCRVTNRTRDFGDQVALLGRDMNDRYSGSIIYEWHIEVNDYGIASYPNDAATGTPSLRADYTSLKSRWATLSPIGVKATAYNPSLTKRACPESTSKVWLVQAKAGTEIPTLGLSGFTAPTRVPGSSTRSARLGSSETTTPETVSPASARGPKISGGAIAGIVIGAIIFIIFLLGAFVVLRRRRNSGAKQVGSSVNSESNQMAFHSNVSPYQGGTLLELPGAQERQELGPAQMQYELKVDEPITELSHQQEHNRQPVYVLENQQRHEREQVQSVPTTETSSHVQAQRRREVEWLEMEEARMRQRREQLQNQNTERMS